MVRAPYLNEPVSRGSRSTVMWNWMALGFTRGVGVPLRDGMRWRFLKIHPFAPTSDTLQFSPKKGT